MVKYSSSPVFCECVITCDPRKVFFHISCQYVSVAAEELYLMQRKACPQPFDHQVKCLSHSKERQVCPRRLTHHPLGGAAAGSISPVPGNHWLIQTTDFNPSREAMGTIFYNLW